MAKFSASNETESAIFDAALKIFARKGKDGARMQEIADEAGINKAMLHYYFRSKEKLYEAVFRHVMSHFFAAMDNVLNKNQPIEIMLREMVDVYLTEHASHPDVHRLWVHENLNGAPHVRQLIQEQQETENAPGPFRLLQRIRSAVEQGEIRPVDPVHLLISFLGLTIMFFVGMPTFTLFDSTMALDNQECLEKRKQHVFNLLYHGISN